MKKYTWLLFILYFGVFVAFGVIFYLKYLDQFLKSGASPQTVETIQSAEYIYYSEANNLFRVSTKLQLDPKSPERVERFQSTGKVNDVDINKTGNWLAYEVENRDGLREVWQVDIQTRESTKIAFAGTQGLSDFQEFIRPKFSPDGQRLGLIGLGSIDQILIYDVAGKSFTVVTEKFAVKLSDFTWEDNEKIIFCTTNLLANTCSEINLLTLSDREILKAEVSQMAMSQAGLLYLAKDQESFNLFLRDLQTLQSTSISDLKAPKKVNRFRSAGNGHIVYDVSDGNLTDIYFAKESGANKIQLTNDGQSFNAVLNSLGDEVGFQKPFDGIYTLKTDKQDLQKIVNLTSEQVNLLLWR